MDKIPFPPFVHSFPAPAVLIGCGTLERPNLITCSWFGTVCSEPPMVGLAVRPSRYSHDLICDGREFSVNIPRASQLSWVRHCGDVSGRDHDKFRELGITPVPCPPLTHAPMIAECSLVLACRVKQEFLLGSHRLFLSEVVAVHGKRRHGDKNARPDFFPVEQIVYLDGLFWTLNPLN